MSGPEMPERDDSPAPRPGRHPPEPRPDYQAQDPYRHVVAGRKALGAVVLAAILLAMALTVFFTGRGEAQDLRFFRIGTASPAGTYFQIGGMIASAVSGPPGAPDCTRGGTCGVPGMIAVAVATQGSVQNVDLLRADEIEAALIQSDVAYWAANGIGPFEGRADQASIQAIGRLYTEQLHLVVRAESEIEELADLAGHRVSLGAPGSGTLVLAQLLLDAIGLGEQEIALSFLRPDDAADRMLEGEIDAFFAIGGAPILAISDLARRIPIRLVSVEGPDVIGLVYDQPFLTSAIIAPRLYRNVPVARTIGVTAIMVVRSDVDADTVYRLTRALWHPTTSTFLANGHPRGRDIRLGDSLVGVPIPIHPGAAAYYELIGLTGMVIRDPPLGPEAMPPSLAEAEALAGGS